MILNKVYRVWNAYQICKKKRVLRRYIESNFLTVSLKEQAGLFPPLLLSLSWFLCLFLSSLPLSPFLFQFPSLPPIELLTKKREDREFNAQESS